MTKPKTEPPKNFGIYFTFVIGCGLAFIGGLVPKELGLFDQIIQSLGLGACIGIIFLIFCFKEAGLLALLSPIVCYFQGVKNNPWSKTLIFLISWIFTFSLGIFVGMRSPSLLLGIPLGGFFTSWSFHNVIEWPSDA
jgi:hypothetical protein